MKRVRKSEMFGWILGALVLICLLAIAPLCAEAHAPGVVLSGSGTAAIDGVMSPGEWSGAASIGFQANVPSSDGGGTTPATLYVMNDGTNLYLALKIARTSFGGATNPVFEFDNNNNGVREDGDDVFGMSVGISSPVMVIDDYRYTCPGVSAGSVGCGPADTDSLSGFPPPGTVDGAAAATNDGAFTVIELSHPLKSGDSLHDFSLRLGDTVGFTLSLRLFSLAAQCNSGPACYADTGFPSADLSGASFGDIVISIPTNTNPGGVITGSVKSDSNVGIGNVRVQVYGAIAMPMPPMLVGETQTDAMGAYRMTGLQTGTYLVCFDGTLSNYMNECYNDVPWNSWNNITNATPIPVITGQTTTLGDAVLSQGGAIAGSVKNNIGMGIGNVWVSVYDSNNMWIKQVQTDQAGNYIAGGLQTGGYKVCFDAGMTMTGYLNECYDNTSWGDIANATLVMVMTGQTSTLNDVVLMQGGVITGAVRNTINIGIGNVSVQVYNLSMIPTPMPAGSTLTDPSGSYTVGGLQTGAYKVCFDGSSSGYIKECYDDKPWSTWNDIVSADTVSVVAGQTTSLNNAVLTSGGTISGQVTSDGTTGIPNVWVNVCRYDGATGLCNYAGGIPTDLSGNYSVGGLASGSYKIWFDTSMLLMMGSNYLSQWYNNKEDEAGADLLSVNAPFASTVNVRLVPGGRISGIVTNGITGIPAVWARVFDSNGVPLPMMGMGATTNLDGTYSVGGLRTGGYKVCFDAGGTGYFSQCYFNKAWDPVNADTVPVAASYTTSGIDAVLSQGGAIIGRVTDGASGLFNVNVVFYEALTGMWTGSAMTDWNGNYSIRSLATGGYKVYFSSMTPGYLSEWYNDKTDMNTANVVTITAGQTTTLNDVVLAKLGSVTGVVKNVSGAGIGMVWVTVFDLSVMPMPMPMPIGSAQTGTNGIYTVTGLQAGTYRVCFDGSQSNYMNECYDKKPWSTGEDIAGATPVPVTMGHTTRLDDAELAPGGVVAGAVKNSSGAGLGMVTVNVYDLTGMWVRGTSTDWSGNYSVGGLQTGTYKVCFDGTAAGYGNECYDNQIWMDLTNTTPVPVAAGQTTVLNDAVLAELGAVAGSVRNLGGQGIGNVMVTVYDTSMMMPMPMPMPIRSAPTGTNGSYTITGLQTGAYRVCFDGSSYGYVNECYDDKPWNSWSDIASATSVSVTAGQTTNLNDAILAQGGAITGAVKSGGSGIGMVTVNVYDSGNALIRATSTDLSGNYVMGGLQGGSYKVCFDAGMAGYASECYDDQEWLNLAGATLVSVVTGQTTTLRNAVLAQGGVIAGAVKNSGGSGIGMVTVNVYDSNSMWLRGTMTDWTGSYSIGGLQSGNYKVCFDAMMSGGYSSECYDNQPWMDPASATLVTVVTGQTTTLRDAVLTQAGYFSVSTGAGPGGSISPISQSILNGTAAVFMIMPDAGYEISSVSGCGGAWTGGNSYSTGPTTSDCTVMATFSRILDTVPDAFAYIDQTGAMLNTLVTSNALTVSGINAPALISITGGQYSINSGAFTTAAGTVNNGNSVRVQLTSSAVYAATTNATLTIGGVSGTFSVTTLTIPIYTITSTAGIWGSVMPSGTLSVISGDSAVFTITPNDGYRIAGVSVDGVSQGAVGTYTFTNVQANHTINASFLAEPKQSFSVRALLIKWWNKQQAIGFVTMTADLGAEKPSNNDVVSLSLDGVQLFAAPFSEFKRGLLPGAYLLARQDLLVRLDFTTHRLFVATPKMSLAGLDAGNGVDVKMSVGAAIAVEHIVMTPAPANSLIFRRTGVVGEP